MIKKISSLIVMLAMLLSFSFSALAQDNVELVFLCYQDGIECEVYTDLLNDFMAENEGITVVVETVPYQTILDSLPVNVEVGQGPDIARLTLFSNLADFYLDLRPLLSDPAIMDDNFNPAVLAAFRADPEGDALNGYPDALTVTAPFVNATLFEQAEIELLGEGATWAEWMEALSAVAEATDVPYAITTDNRGHRVAGPAMSMGATFFDEDGNFDLLDDEGFSSFAEMFKSWIDAGLTPADIWAGGGTYNAGDPFFVNVQTVMYFSGSWNISGFANNIGDAFDWVVAPNPTGPGGSTGVAGGAGLAAFDSGDDARNAAIAAVIEYLLQPEVYAEFSGRNLFIPAHAGAVDLVEFDTDDEQVVAALTQFSQEALKLQDQALALNNHPFAGAYYGASNTRLSQYFAGELTLEELTQRLQQDIDEAVATAGS